MLSANHRRLLDRLSLPVGRSATASRQGGHRSPKMASGVEVADHRPYIPGDDVRYIDWKAFARHGQLILRQFEEERDARIYVLIDLSGSMSRGTPTKLDIARRLTAAFAYVGMKQYDRVRVLPFGEQLERETRPLASMEDLPEMERFLEGFASGGLTNFEASVRTLAERYPARGLAIVISDLMNPMGFAEGLKLLGGLGHDVRLVHVGCKEDLDPDVRGEIELHDAETGETIRLRVTPKLLAAYREQVSLHIAECGRACRSMGSRMVSIDVTTPVEEQFKMAIAGGQR